MAKSAAKVRRIGRGYADLRDHIEALERAGLLVRVRRLINKDTEMHPLVRWQYRGGLPEKDWRGFLFENVTEVKGNHYDIPVAVGVMAGSKYIVAVGLDCDADGIADKWQKAFRSPIEPMMVKNGPVHQVVLTGADVKRSGGLDQFPRADLDARLRRRAVHHRRALDHQRPRHRHSQRRQLPRPPEGERPPRHLPRPRAARARA